MLSIQNINKKVRGHLLLDDLSFELSQGDICGLIGPNGAGKTTLIRIITGLIKPNAGEVRISDVSVQKNRKKALRTMGALVESPIFFDYLTGRKALRNLAILHPNLSSQEQKNKVEEVLKITNLLEHADKKVRTYSLGMKQRLGIAQALLGNPDCIILDEPANGLDPMGIKFLRDVVLNLRKEKNITFLISSHLLDELQQVCDHVVVINKGKIIWKGHISELEGESSWVYILKNSDQVHVALNLMKNKYLAKKIDDNKLELVITEDESEEVTNMFINNGLTIKGLEKKSKRLEDIFIEMMKS